MARPNGHCAGPWETRGQMAVLAPSRLHDLDTPTTIVSQRIECNPLTVRRPPRRSVVGSGPRRELNQVCAIRIRQPDSDPIDATARCECNAPAVRGELCI